MFEQYGTDYANASIQLNSLLPAVNQSEASYSLLSTLFQRWLSKANLSNSAGTIGFTKTPLAGAIQESTAIRQAYQLYPVFYREQGDEKFTMDWNDILRKLAFTGVDPTKYPQWGPTSAFDFSPPINPDMFVNYSNYYWVNAVDTIEQPDYVTIAKHPTAFNDWSSSNKWVHKAVLGGNLAFAKQAQLPILEFDDIELCRWYTVERTWKKLNPLLGEYVDTTDQPEWMSPTYIPVSGFSELADINWQLQSESLVPTGGIQYHLDGTTTPLMLPSTLATGVYQSTNVATQMVRYRFESDGYVRQYLRDQNNIIVLQGDQYQQITDFVEVENTTLGQYGIEIDVPVASLGSVPLTAYIGAHCSLEEFRPLSRKLVYLAPGFTSFTPSTGAALPLAQHRDLYQFKLQGQRRLTKYQLPLFNLYSLTAVGDTGVFNNQTTAGYVVKYAQDSAQSIDAVLGQRVVTNSVDLPFVLDLVSPTGALLSYRSNSPIADEHFTVWKTRSTHIPSYVDATRTPQSDFTIPGGWEPSRLLTDNPLRETRSTFTFSQVINHFQNLADNLPGTIRISDDGGNYLMSSAIADNLSIPSLANFIASELYTFRLQLEQQIKIQLLNTPNLAVTAVADIPQLVYNSLRTATLHAGGADSVYSDTLSYDANDDLGYPSFPLTFGILGLCTLSAISVESDRKLNHASIVTHDGSRYNITISPTATVGMETALSTSIAVGSIFPTPLTNYCVWRKNPALTYRFECYYFSTSTPTAPIAGRTWFNPGNLNASPPVPPTASVWTGAYWHGIVVSTLWVLFDVSSLILEVFALQEREIAALIRTRSLSIIDVAPTASTQYDAIIASSYASFAYQYSQATNTQLTSRLLSAPSATDPFTWYYGNVQLVNINWGSIDSQQWANSVFELYTNLYNTPIPHKQPWKLQGQIDKPIWWDSEYLDVSGTRYWSTTMWSNIANGIVPYTKLLEDNTVGTGNPHQLVAPAVIPVNTSGVTIGGYAPDDLLPPYLDTTTYPALLDYSVTNGVNIVLISAANSINPTEYLGAYSIFPTTLSQGSFIENIWKTNETSISRGLVAAYQVDPLVVVTKLTNRNRRMLAGLSVNARTNDVAKNTDPLHGENGIVDTTIFAALTFLARHNNFSSHNNSPLYAWKSWSTRLAYQTNSLIVPQTLKVYQDCYDLNEYSVVLKKSENVRKIRFSNIIVTLNSIDSTITSTGRGENWIFNLTCSESDPTVRQKYNSLQQGFVWNAATLAFDIADVADTQLRWFDGEQLQIVNPPPSILINSFYISRANGVIRLYNTAIDAVAGTNPIDFGNLLIGVIQFRTVKATFTAGNLNWETVEVDRRSSQSFNFAESILVTGVQPLIDFIVGYVEYMQDDGIVINAGETPAFDPDTNAVISWQQQITKAIDRIFTSNGLSALGYKPIFIPNSDGVLKPIATDRTLISIPFVEINPYRNAIYFHTPDGVICDFEHTPYVNEFTSKAALFDDTASPIVAAELVPLRTDRITAVVFNDAQPPRPVNIGQDVSRRIAFGEISLDFYEHVLVFDQQTSNGLTIFDRFFNLQKTLLNLEFQKSVDFYYRPVMGGFSVTQAGTLPNFETTADYQRNDYNVANSNELIQSTIDSRQMLGKLPLSYFQDIPVTSKTEFQFWQQMIREKGTKGSVAAFTRHKLYDQAKYDEFWAWKLGTFGAVDTRKQIEMAFQLGDVLYQANTFLFSDTALPSGTTSYHYANITPLDQSRWIDFPNYLDQVGQNGPVFGQNVQESVAIPLLIATQFLHFNLTGDKFTAMAGTVDITDRIVNHNTIDVSAIDTPATIEITSYLPAYNEISPVRVIDATTKLVTNTLPIWDPANSLHSNAIAQFDYVVASNPALYNRTMINVSPSPWGINQVGQYMLDSSSLVYKPYFDDKIFSLDARILNWGQLADGFTATAYQWIENTTAPTISSKDGPLTRHVLKTRPYVECTLTASTFTATSVPFVNNGTVILYKRPSVTIPTPNLDTILGVEYTIQNISGNTFSLVENGVTLTVPTGAETDLLFVTSGWNDAVVTELDPLSYAFSVCEFPINATTFQLPWTNDSTQSNFVIQDLTSSAVVVNVNGSSTPFSVTNTGLLSLFTASGTPLLSLRPVDIVTVYYSQQSMSATGIPMLSDPTLTYVDIDVPYTEYTQIVNQLSVTSYYYWASIPTLVNNPNKPLPLLTTVAQLTQPQSGDYMVIHTDRQLLTLWGLYGTHQLDKKALAIDLDKTMRDKYFASSAIKPSNEQWVLFREFQEGYPAAPIWNAVAATVIGTRVINPTSTIIVPSPDRVAYDYLYDTTLSYGTGQMQTLISPVRAQELFTNFFSVANPLVDSTLYVLLTGTEWMALLTKHKYADALTFVYANLPPTLLNSFIFVILREGLYSGYQYDGLFKTSYVALQTSQKVVVG